MYAAARPVTFTRDVAPILYQELRRVPSRWGSRSVSADHLRRCREARGADRAGDGQPLHAAVEAGARTRRFRGRARADGGADRYDPALGRGGRAARGRRRSAAGARLPQREARASGSGGAHAEAVHGSRGRSRPVSLLRPAARIGRGTIRGRDGISARQSEGGASRHSVCRPHRAGAQAREGAGGGYPCFGAPGFLPGGGLGGWTPGSPPIRMPDGVSTRAEQAGGPGDSTPLSSDGKAGGRARRGCAGLHDAAAAATARWTFRSGRSGSTFRRARKLTR